MRKENGKSSVLVDQSPSEEENVLLETKQDPTWQL